MAEGIEGVGGILNAYTSREQTGYWAKVPSTHFVKSFGVLADMVRDSLFNTRGTRPRARGDRPRKFAPETTIRRRWSGG